MTLWAFIVGVSLWSAIIGILLALVLLFIVCPVWTVRRVQQHRRERE